jgi:hypothetical protein
MAGKKFTTSSREEAYKTWALKRFVKILLFAIVSFGAIHLMARAQVPFAMKIDLIGRYILRTAPDDPAPASTGPSAPDEEASPESS